MWQWNFMEGSKSRVCLAYPTSHTSAYPVAPPMTASEWICTVLCIWHRLFLCLLRYRKQVSQCRVFRPPGISKQVEQDKPERELWDLLWWTKPSIDQHTSPLSRTLSALSPLSLRDMILRRVLIADLIQGVIRSLCCAHCTVSCSSQGQCIQQTHKPLIRIIYSYDTVDILAFPANHEVFHLGLSLTRNNSGKETQLQLYRDSFCSSGNLGVQFSVVTFISVTHLCVSE